MSREAMQMALEALESDPISHAGLVSRKQAITALRERLAQPEQEPIATVESVATVVSESGNQEITMSWWHEPALPVGTKLYTEPPKREWVGLTDEERSYYLQSASNVGWWQAAKMIEAKLKEKNHG